MPERLAPAGVVAAASTWMRNKGVPGANTHTMAEEPFYLAEILWEHYGPNSPGFDDMRRQLVDLKVENMPYTEALIISGMIAQENAPPDLSQWYSTTEHQIETLIEKSEIWYGVMNIWRWLLDGRQTDPSVRRLRQRIAREGDLVRFCSGRVAPHYGPMPHDHIHGRPWPYQKTPAVMQEVVRAIQGSQRPF